MYLVLVAGEGYERFSRATEVVELDFLVASPLQRSVFRVWGSGFGVGGLEIGIWGLGFGVWGLGIGNWDLRFGV